MNPSDFAYLELRIATDKEFARLLVENPRQALKRAGLHLTPEILAAIQGMDGSAFEKLFNIPHNEEMTATSV